MARAKVKKKNQFQSGTGKKNYQNSHNELLQERQRLHDLIMRRSKEGLQAVAEMSKRRLSLEHRVSIIKANNMAATGTRYDFNKTGNSRLPRSSMKKLLS